MVCLNLRHKLIRISFNFSSLPFGAISLGVDLLDKTAAELLAALALTSLRGELKCEPKREASLRPVEAGVAMLGS